MKGAQEPGGSIAGWLGSRKDCAVCGQFLLALSAVARCLLLVPATPARILFQMLEPWAAPSADSRTAALNPWLS